MIVTTCVVNLGLVHCYQTSSYS